MTSFEKFFIKFRKKEEERKQNNETKELLKRLRYLKQKSDLIKSEVKKVKSKRQP